MQPLYTTGRHAHSNNNNNNSNVMRSQTKQYRSNKWLVHIRPRYTQKSLELTGRIFYSFPMTKQIFFPEIVFIKINNNDDNIFIII